MLPYTSSISLSLCHKHTLASYKHERMQALTVDTRIPRAYTGTHTHTHTHSDTYTYCTNLPKLSLALVCSNTMQRACTYAKNMCTLQAF